MHIAMFPQSAFAPSSANRGFTLVELMVVVVILTLFAGMMTLSVGTSDARKNMAFYEHLQSNLAYIRLLSMERMQPYGLAIKLAKAGSDSNSELVVVRLANTYHSQKSPTSNENTLPNTELPHWELDNQVEPLPIPSNVQVDIQPVTANTTLTTNTPLPWFDPSQAPPIMWFGTGETTPVKITLQSVNPTTHARYLIGNTLLLNSAGNVEQLP